jgi:hypothetical protein
MNSRVVDDEYIGGPPKLVKSQSFFYSQDSSLCSSLGSRCGHRRVFFANFEEQETTFKVTTIHKMD